MAGYLISIIRPKGYLHSEAFREIAETLQYGFRSLGHASGIGENVLDSNGSVTNVILGAHLLSEGEMKLIPPNSIIYNMEQLGSATLSEAYYQLAQRYPIWDYSPLNIEKWGERQCAHPPVLVEIGYVPELRRIVPSAEQDIDVLFYGSVNEHRLKILRQLSEAGARVHSVFGVYGRERDALIARAKIVLNVHYYATNLFEAVRVSYLLANSKAVVSEASPDVGYLEDAIAVFPYNELAEGCLGILRDDVKRKELEVRAFEHFSQRSAGFILGRALSGIAGPGTWKRSFDLFDTLVAARCGGPAGDHLDELFPISANIAKVKRGDVIVSDYYDPAGARKALEVAQLGNELIVTPDGKYSGTIWPALIKQGVFSHTGDNVESDVRRPRQFGLTATLAGESRFTTNEEYLRQRGFGGVAGAMREARLTTGKTPVGDLWRLQNQVNFPFLVLGAIGLRKAASRLGCKTVLMSARDCCLWQFAVKAISDLRVEYFLTSRITRVFPTEEYLEYVNSLLSEPSLFVDLDGTGWSLRRLVAKTKRPDSSVFLLVKVKDESQEAMQEGIATSGSIPLEYLTTGYAIALEPANFARHAMVSKVEKDRMETTNPTGFDWEGSREIAAQHGAFHYCLGLLKHYEIPSDVSERELSETLQTILSWYHPYATSVDFQKATFIAEDRHIFATLEEQKTSQPRILINERGNCSAMSKSASSL
ncbi:MAG TPA: hypothetical protein VMI10_00500 [Terriglobales bacterium]|nr:hypothetical protein [Terriglobales bacterium]